MEALKVRLALAYLTQCNFGSFGCAHSSQSLVIGARFRVYIFVESSGGLAKGS